MKPDTRLPDSAPAGSPARGQHGVSWRHPFGQLIRRHTWKKSRAGTSIGITSDRTREHAHQTGMYVLEVLRFELGYKITKPESFDRRHAQAWGQWINRQHHGRSKATATLAGYATVIRHLLRWADKAHLVEVFDATLERQAVARQLTATHDKSWEGNQVDIEQAFERVWARRPWVAMALLAQDAFGLRRREAIQLHPLSDLDLTGSLVHIRRGAKGGRPRVIPIEHHWQHLVAERLLAFVRQRNRSTARGADDDQPLADPDLDLRQAIGAYRNLLSTLGFTKAGAGVTGHGLRAGYVCRRLDELGICPVVKGGTGRHEDPAEDLRRHRIVSEAVGHGRKNVIGAYAGALHVRISLQATQALRARGWLLPENDPATVDENVRRRNAFIKDPAAFALEIQSLQQGQDHAAL